MQAPHLLHTEGSSANAPRANLHSWNKTAACLEGQRRATTRGCTHAAWSTHWRGTRGGTSRWHGLASHETVQTPHPSEAQGGNAHHNERASAIQAMRYQIQAMAARNPQTPQGCQCVETPGTFDMSLDEPLCDSTEYNRDRGLRGEPTQEKGLHRQNARAPSCGFRYRPTYCTADGEAPTGQVNHMQQATPQPA